MKKFTFFTAALAVLLSSASAYGQSAGDTGYVPGERVTSFTDGAKYFMFNTFEKSTGVAYGFLQGHGGSAICSYVQESPATMAALAEGTEKYSNKLWTVTLSGAQASFRNYVSGGKTIGGALYAGHDGFKWNFSQVSASNVSNLATGKFLAADGSMKATAEATEDDKVFLIGGYFNANGNSLRNSSGAHPFAFYTAVEKTYIGVTYDYQKDGTKIASQRVVQIEGSASQAPALTGYTLGSYSLATIDKDQATNNELTVVVTVARDYAAICDELSYYKDMVPEGAVGTPTNWATLKTEVQTALDNYSSDNTSAEYRLALETVFDKVKNGQLVPFEYGKYYRFYSAYPAFRAKNVGLSTFTGNETVRWRALYEGNAAGVFYVCPESSDNTSKKVLAVNRELYLQGPKGALQSAGNTGNQFSCMSIGYGAQYGINYGGYINLEGANAEAATGDLPAGLAEPGGKSSSSAWFIVPVTEIELELSQVGDNYYGTVYMPFPVKGEDLYTGQLNADETQLTMTKVDPATAVAAKTGLVVKSSNKSVVLTIMDEGETQTGNSLKGTLTYVNNTSVDANCVVLGKNSVGEVGFFSLAAGTDIPANKAYLLLRSAQDAAIGMAFEGEATAIGHVSLEHGSVRSDAPVFDLAGRRVGQPRQGGLYIQNGQKFIAR